MVVVLAVGLGGSILIMAAEARGSRQRRAMIKECPPPPPPSPQNPPQIDAVVEISHQYFVNDVKSGRRPRGARRNRSDVHVMDK